MHTVGSFAPESVGEVRERYESLGPVAQRVVREVAKAMDLRPEEYDERVTGAVVETAREVLFAAELEVSVADRETFDAWVDDRDVEIVQFGSTNVENVAWHPAPFADAVVATTFQDEEKAAVETLRRQALGTVYRDVLE